MNKEALINRGDWPDAFDFANDSTCQNIFSPYIAEQLSKLAAYDSQRPTETTYIFNEHARRVAKDVQATCDYISLPTQIGRNMYQALLIHDMGKTALPVKIWDSEEKPSDSLKAQRRTHTNIGAEQFAKDFENIDHPFKTLALDIILYHHEQMDGNGTHEIEGNNLSSPVRLASIVEAFDGWSIPRPHFGDRDISPAGVIARMRNEKLHMFDEELFEAFAASKLSP